VFYGAVRNWTFPASIFGADPVVNSKCDQLTVAGVSSQTTIGTSGIDQDSHSMAEFFWLATVDSWKKEKKRKREGNMELFEAENFFKFWKKLIFFSFLTQTFGKAIPGSVQ
jgi:hypothetical protein